MEICVYIMFMQLYTSIRNHLPIIKILAYFSCFISVLIHYFLFLWLVNIIHCIFSNNMVSLDYYIPILSRMVINGKLMLYLQPYSIIYSSQYIFFLICAFYDEWWIMILQLWHYIYGFESHSMGLFLHCFYLLSHIQWLKDIATHQIYIGWISR